MSVIILKCNTDNLLMMATTYNSDMAGQGSDIIEFLKPHLQQLMNMKCAYCLMNMYRIEG